MKLAEQRHLTHLVSVHDNVTTTSERLWCMRSFREFWRILAKGTTGMRNTECGRQVKTTPRSCLSCPAHCAGCALQPKVNPSQSPFLGRVSQNTCGRPDAAAWWFFSPFFYHAACDMSARLTCRVVVVDSHWQAPGRTCILGWRLYVL